MVYAYIRVSTEQQSCEGQEFEIRQYCRKSGVEVSSWVREFVSGTTDPSKRSLGRLLKRMKRGDLLLCTELSRLGRSMMMVMGILNTCSSKGISIRTIKDGFELSESINSKIIAFAFSLAAEIERNLISQRTKEALASKKASGVRLGRPPGRSAKKDLLLDRMPEIKQKLCSGVKKSELARFYGVHVDTLNKYLRSERQ